jgi:hypothetical protein
MYIMTEIFHISNIASVLPYPHNFHYSSTTTQQTGLSQHQILRQPRYFIERIILKSFFLVCFYLNSFAA